MNTVTCPICQSQTFKSSIGRPYNVCLNCGSLERTRVIYMALAKLGIPHFNDRILHFAPEKCFIDLFSKSHGDKYETVDLFPEKYKHLTRRIKRFDICEDLYSLPSESWDLILHNHVLEHLFCSVKGVLRGFDRILKPGGVMIFTIPIHAKYPTTIEDLNPDLSDAEREKKLGQKDHVRLFGRDVLNLITEALGIDCFIPATSLFIRDEFEMAGIPWKPEREPHGESIFLYRKSHISTLSDVRTSSPKFIDFNSIKYKLDGCKERLKNCHNELDNCQDSLKRLRNHFEQHNTTVNPYSVSDADIYESIWKSLNQPEDFPENYNYYPPEIPINVTKSVFNKMNHYRVLIFDKLTDDEQNWLSQEGLLISNLETIGKDDIELEELYVNHFIKDKKIKLSRQSKTRTFNGYQSMVQTGYIYSNCPISGKFVRSNQSFFIECGTLQYFIYRFLGQEVFYLVFGHWRSNKLFLYLPSKELLLWFNPKDIGNGKLVINSFKSYMVSYWKYVKNYIFTNQPKTVAVTYGHISNLAHYVWNEVTGIQYLAVNGCLEKVDKFLHYPYDYYIISTLFSQIQAQKFEAIAKETNLFLTILENNYFAMRVTDSWVSEELANKIYQISFNQCSRNPVVMEEIEKSRRSFPLVWITIRSHHRYWVGQIEGIANIINKLSQDYPDLGVIFDGWGRIDKNLQDPRSDSIIKQETEIMQSIKNLVTSSVSIYSAIGLTNFEKSVWAKAIDIYIASEGAGLVHVLWVANKPGIVHTHTSHWQQHQFWVGHRQNAVQPVFISKEHIRDDKTSRIGNYDCDWQVIYKEVISLLKKLKRNS